MVPERSGTQPPGTPPRPSPIFRELQWKMGEVARQGGWVQIKNSHPTRGESCAHAVPPDLNQPDPQGLIPTHLFAACNGANRLSYSLTAVSFENSARGGFSSGGCRSRLSTMDLLSLSAHRPITRPGRCVWI